MSEKEKSLPRPPSTPFGRRKLFEQTDVNRTLISDELAIAMAEGKLDEYMKEKISDSEQARKLTMMMMGMSGIADMTPPDLTKGPKESEEVESPGGMQPPEDLVKAAADGDVKGLMQMLRRECEKIRPGTEESVPAGPAASGAPVVEKEVVEAFASIAAENSLTMDWLILRAIKLYVEEYRKTGRL